MRNPGEDALLRLSRQGFLFLVSSDISGILGCDVHQSKDSRTDFILRPRIPRPSSSLFLAPLSPHRHGANFTLFDTLSRTLTAAERAGKALGELRRTNMVRAEVEKIV